MKKVIKYKLTTAYKKHFIFKNKDRYLLQQKKIDIKRQMTCYLPISCSIKIVYIEYIYNFCFQPKRCLNIVTYFFSAALYWNIPFTDICGNLAFTKAGTVKKFKKKKTWVNINILHIIKILIISKIDLVINKCNIEKKQEKGQL